MLFQLAVNGVVAGCLAALLAGAFSILYSASRFFVFTFGASYTVAAYSLLAGKGVAPMWALCAIGVLLATALGAGLELGIYRPVRRRGKQPLMLMLASIGLYTILQNTVSLAFGDATRTVRPTSPPTSLSFLGARLTTVQLAIALTAVALMAAVWLSLRKASYGLQLRAVLNDGELARAVGLDVDRVVLLGAALGSALAGAAAVLSSQDFDLVPTMGFEALLIGVVGAVVGGITTTRGAALGGFLVGLLRHVAVWQVPTQWQDGILFLLLLCVLLFRPHGLLTVRSRRAV